MSEITVVLSLLHESPERNSATRRFRTAPVLKWTLDRLRRSRHVDSIALICWEDQLRAVLPIAKSAEIEVLAKGPRAVPPELEAITASRRWADGWRGGLLGTCAFDAGFYGPWFREVAERFESTAIVLCDPSSALVDPALVDGLIEQAEGNPETEICFTPATPGQSLALVRRPLLERLATAKTHPGRLMHYHPDQLSREPLAGVGCTPIAAAVARTTHRLTLDSDRQIARITTAMVSLNGHLISTEAEELIRRLGAQPNDDALPRDVTIELTARRASRPIHSPARHLDIQRPDADLEWVKRTLEELARLDDVRLTFAGVGDPMCSPLLFDALAAAREAGVSAVHVETDLLCDAASAARLAEQAVDVVSVHLPAVTPQTYERVMGVDGYSAVLANIRMFLASRLGRRRGVPILAPTFMKCRENFAEMEPWYDQWLRAVGCAVIMGPSDYAGQIPDAALADMAPPKRRPCARLASRLSLLSDGRVVSCEQDALGLQTVGDALKSPITEIWSRPFADFRAAEARCGGSDRPLCGKCREWHRP